MRKIADPASHFWERVDKSGDCWLWTGARVPKGYGSLTFDGRTDGAHRVAWVLTFGPIPDGMWVLHHCDNPPCVRPSHLFLGTNRVNVADSIAKGRRAHLSSKLPTQPCERCGRTFRIWARTRPRRFCGPVCSQRRAIAVGPGEI